MEEKEIKPSVPAAHEGIEPSASKQEKRLQKFEKFSFIMFILAALFGGSLFGFILSEVRSSKAIDLLAQYRPSTPTILYDVKGKKIAELYRSKQKIIPYRKLPVYLTYAFLSTEDQNFYNHFGIDFSAILRAAFVNLIHLRVVQGGSTLTQQVAKVITSKTKKTFSRKFYEAVLSLQIESRYSKEEILEIYFNIIYLGHGTRGIAAASKLYFDKDAENLTLGESALLARFPKAPENYSPFKHLKRAVKAQKLILSLMAENGFISKKKADAVYKKFWPKYSSLISLRSPTQTTFGNKMDKAPFFTDYVREILKRNEYIGEEKLYTGGLKVYTTLDLDIQQKVKKQMKAELIKGDKIAQSQARTYVQGADPELLSAYNALSKVFSLPSIVRSPATLDQIFSARFRKKLMRSAGLLSFMTGSNNSTSAISYFDQNTATFKENLHLQGAFVALDHKKGYIQSMFGGRKYSVKNQFNRVLQARRQPGSSFKPFVYGAGIDSGILHTARGFSNAPTVEIGDDGASWSPENYDAKFSGMIPLSRALSASLNIIAVRVYNLIGPDRIIDFASKMLKIKDKARFSPNPSLALGSSEVSPMEMAIAYSTFANKGKEVIPFAIRYVTDSQDNIIFNREREIESILAIKERTGEIQVIPEDTAYIMHTLLQGVVNHGTATRIRTKSHFYGNAAGKTGTTSGWYDAWFCGYTADLTGILWMGFDRRTISLGRHRSGGNVAAPLWGRIMKDVYKKRSLKKFDFKKPWNVYTAGVCAYTGRPVFPGVCTKTIGGYYVHRKGVHLNYGSQCDGEHKKSLLYDELLQEMYNITDKEIGKKKYY